MIYRACKSSLTVSAYQPMFPENMPANFCFTKLSKPLNVSSVSASQTHVSAAFDQWMENQDFCFDHTNPPILSM
jgi:hypothetical protein